MPIMGCFRVQPGSEMTVDEFKMWLLQFDMDHDGNISKGELREALLSLHVWFSWWKAREGMKKADSNHNGHIDSPSELEELIRFAQERLQMKITPDN